MSCAQRSLPLHPASEQSAPPPPQVLFICPGLSLPSTHPLEYSRQTPILHCHPYRRPVDSIEPSHRPSCHPLCWPFDCSVPDRRRVLIESTPRPDRTTTIALNRCSISDHQHSDSRRLFLVTVRASTKERCILRPSRGSGHQPMLQAERRLLDLFARPGEASKSLKTKVLFRCYHAVCQ